MVGAHSCKEIIWLKILCSDIGIKQGAVKFYFDNQSVIFLAKNPTLHAMTKHIDVQYNFFRYMVEYGKEKLVKIDTLMNVVNSLTNLVST
jgi:hypothetical protein